MTSTDHQSSRAAPAKKSAPVQALVGALVSPISMPRFLFSAAISSLLIIAGVWVWAANGRMWFLDPEYGMWSAKFQMLETCDVGHTTFLGDSRSVAGLIPSEMGEAATNLGLGGGSPIEAFYIAKQILKCETPPKRVVISFPPSNFMREQVYWDRTALYGFSPFEELEEARRTSERLNDPIVYHVGRFASIGNYIKNSSYRISFPSYYFLPMLNARFFLRRDANERMLEATLRGRGHHLFGTAQRTVWPNGDTIYPEFKPSPVMNFYFERTIAALSDAKIDVYFVGMPVNEETHKIAAPILHQPFTQYLNDLSRRFPRFRIVGDPYPSMPADYFGDPEHLNEAGATVWTQRVANELLAAGKFH